ncbi:MAG: serine/threonine-protein kinase [Candidatus Sumerlaeia bacterium]|nr:serine/threonine-protein kinase [Candidatus Sumerlaeia bacterium]
MATDSAGAGLPHTSPVRGEILNDYALEDLIGHGAYALVYLARHKRTGERAAIKHFQIKAGDRRRFFNELKLTLRLDHPQIVRCLGMYTGEAEGADLVFEYANGGNLRSRLERGGKVPYRESIHLLWQLADGVEHAHAASILHRDLKPENILLFEEHGETVYKVGDFGVSKILGPQRGAYTSIGSPFYMAPEQFYERYDFKSDVYALGIMWYEMLTGSVPFEGSVAAIFRGHLNEPLGTLREEIPAEIRGLLDRLCAKNPDERPDASSLKREISDLLATMDTGFASARSTIVEQAAARPAPAVGSADSLFSEMFGGGPAAAPAPAPHRTVDLTANARRWDEDDSDSTVPVKAPPAAPVRPTAPPPVRQPAAAQLDAESLVEEGFDDADAASISIPKSLADLTRRATGDAGALHVERSWSRVVDSKTLGLVDLDDGRSPVCVTAKGIRELDPGGTLGATLFEGALDCVGAEASGMVPLVRSREVFLLRNRLVESTGFFLKDDVSTIAISPFDGAVAACSGRVVACHDAQGRQLWSGRAAEGDGRVALAFDAAGRLMLATIASEDRAVHFLDSAGGIAASHWLPGSVTALAKCRSGAGSWVAVLRKRGPEVLRVGFEGIGAKAALPAPLVLVAGTRDWVAGVDKEGVLHVVDPAAGGHTAFPLEGEPVALEATRSGVYVLCIDRKILKRITHFAIRRPAAEESHRP